MDWTGNGKSIFVCNGASNHTDEARELNDYYATDPKAIDILINDAGITFLSEILEPACGEGHLSKRLEEYGYNVTSYDIVDRGYGEVKNFFDIDRWYGDIVTNPPYKYAKEFVEHALDIVPQGCMVAMFLKLTFLEGQKRKELFKKYPPRYVFVSSSRLQCAKNGDFVKYGKSVNSAVAYAWYVWLKGYEGETVIRWVN